MRTIVAILAVLLFAGWVLCEIEIKPAEGAVVSQADTPEWRRTVHGWEKVQDWQPIVTPSVDLHPGVLGLFLLLVSIFSLVGFETPSLVQRYCHS